MGTAAGDRRGLAGGTAEGVLLEAAVIEVVNIFSAPSEREQADGRRLDEPCVGKDLGDWWGWSVHRSVRGVSGTINDQGVGQRLLHSDALTLSRVEFFRSAPSPPLCDP